MVSGLLFKLWATQIKTGSQITFLEANPGCSIVFDAEGLLCRIVLRSWKGGTEAASGRGSQCAAIHRRPQAWPSVRDDCREPPATRRSPSRRMRMMTGHTLGGAIVTWPGRGRRAGSVERRMRPRDRARPDRREEPPHIIARGGSDVPRPFVFGVAHREQFAAGASPLAP